MSEPTATPTTIAIEVAMTTLVSVRMIARLNEPEASSRTRSRKIRWGGCIVSVSMMPAAHSTSKPPAKASRISTRTSVSRHLMCIDGLDGFVPQKAPQTSRDGAEALVLQNSAVAFPRPGGLDDVEDASRSRRHHSDAVRQHCG